MNNDILDDFNEEPEKKHITNLLNILFVISFMLVLSGLLFLIMHWPYAIKMLYAGIGTSIIWYIIYLGKKYFN